jgi:superfamily I DNA/RNA helicase
MDDTWWVKPDDLDEDQRKVIALPADGGYLVVGPPGSGKSNLLLLRANYLSLGSTPNLAILVFTRTLEEFLASGADRYSFDPSCIMTSTRWQRTFLRRHGVTPPDHERFEDERRALLEAMADVLEKRSIPREYQALFLDEAQDYWPEEIQIFGKLADSIFAVADARQKIYPGADPMDELKKLVKSTHELRHHYRNGRRICRVADALGKRMEGYRSLLEDANYKEQDLPSSVEIVGVSSAEQQTSAIVQRVQTQLKAYPQGLIGIVSPRQEDLNDLWNRLEASAIAEDAVLLHRSGDLRNFAFGRRVCVSTVHSVKGLEFRAMHLADAERFKNFPAQRQMSYVGVTRAKTSLTVYHRERLAGYFKEALDAALDDTPSPSLDDAVGPGGER